MTEAELDEVLTFRWPLVVRRVMGDAGTDGFVRGFARSIAKHGKRQSWKPTPKQERIMRQLLDQFAGPAEPDIYLIERD